MLVDSTSQPQRPDKLRFRNNGRISVINTRRKTSERYSRRIYLDIAFHIPDAAIEDCITYAIDVDAICRLIKSAHNQLQFIPALRRPPHTNAVYHLNIQHHMQ